jgi:hypothetical protein
MDASPAKTTLVYTLAGLAAGSAAGYPKTGAAVGLGLGLRAPKPGRRLFDQTGDPRKLSRAALSPSIDGYAGKKTGDGKLTPGKVGMILGATVAPFTLYPYLLKQAAPDSGYWPRVAVSLGGVFVVGAMMRPGQKDKSGFGGYGVGIYSERMSQPKTWDWKSIFGKNRSSRLRQGDVAGSPYSTAPTVARDLSEARLAAAYAYKIGKGSESSISDLARSGPWASQNTITGVLDTALASGVGRDSRAYLIGVRLRSKGVATPGVSARGKYHSKAKAPPPRASGPTPGPAAAFFSPAVASGEAGGQTAPPWFKNKTVMIGAGVLGAGLVLALVLGGRKR